MGKICQIDCPEARRNKIKSRAACPIVPTPQGEGNDVIGNKMPALRIKNSNLSKNDLYVQAVQHTLSLAQFERNYLVNWFSGVVQMLQERLAALTCQCSGILVHGG